MRDHRYVRPDGTAVMVTEMTNQEIAECLSDGVLVNSIEGYSVTAEDVRERLLIEQLIRELRL